MQTSMNIRPAVEADLPLLVEFIGELAAHEGRPEFATITENVLSPLVFGGRALGSAFIGEVEGQAAAYAIVAERFASFRGTRYLYIEDMLIRPNFRKGGAGRKFLTFLAKIADDMGCARLEWSALDNNDVALGFYDHLKATRETGVVHYTLDRQNMIKLLEQSGD